MDSYQNFGGQYYAQPPPEYAATASYTASPPSGFDNEPKGFAATSPTYHAEGREAGKDLNQPFLAQEPTQSTKFGETGYKDVWAMVLFYMQLIATLVLAIIEAKRLHVHTEDNTDNVDAGKWARIFAVVVVMTAVLAAFYLYLVKKYARPLIIWTNILGILLVYAVGGVYFHFGLVAGGVILLLVGTFLALILYMARARIEFAAVTMSYAAKIIKKYPATIFLAYLGILLQICYFVIWVLALVFIKPAEGHDGLIIMLVFFFYWSTQVIGNIVHVSIGGTVGTYYFFPPDETPSNPTLRSLKRAVTTSFGSVCFGSLLIAVLKTIRFIIRAFSGRRGGFCYLITLCFLRCIESLIRFFNLYAYAQVAIYGKSYIQAAKDTYNLLMNRGLEAFVNTLFINRVIAFGSIVVALLSFCIGWFWGKSLFNNDWEYVVAAVISFCVSFFIIHTALFVVSSAVINTFVCFAEDPEIMRRNDPETYAKFYEAWNNYGSGPQSTEYAVQGQQQFAQTAPQYPHTSPQYPQASPQFSQAPPKGSGYV